MSVTRYTLEKYASIEMNHVSFPGTSRVFAQLPLNTSDFTTAAPAENGMWLVYDNLGGTVRKPDAVTESIGILYNNEKEYNQFVRGLNQWALAPGAGNVYPRLGKPMVGDTYTTNCFCYSTTGDSSFADDNAVDTALAGYATTPLYLVLSTTGAPMLTKAADTTALTAAGTIAKIIKVYTMPNGELGLKVEFTKVA